MSNRLVSAAIDSSKHILRAAIVGLGQVGSRFDEEPRPSIWTHAGAYLALPDDYALVAAADPVADQRARFASRCPAAQVFDDPAAMVRQIHPDVLSICTPPAGRARLVAQLLDEARPRVLICEKPLELDESQRKDLVARCAAAGVVLMVNYSRRFEATYRHARRSIAAGEIGKVISVTVRAPNRLWSIGSHAVNLLIYLAAESPSSWLVQPLPALEEAGEPAANALFAFPGAAAGALITVGKKANLIFEADVVGERGRIVVAGNGEEVSVTALEPSPHFAGYQVPGVAHKVARDPSYSPFVELVKEAAALARGGDANSSDGASALSSESVLEAIVALTK